jgi:transcriptional regulator with XRE-family HTH domain
MKKLKQSQLAKELGISKSYLSMILSGQRQCPPELVVKLQSIPGVHKVVKNQPWEMPSKQRVVGSNPSRDASRLSNPLPQAERQGYASSIFKFSFTQSRNG